MYFIGRKLATYNPATWEGKVYLYIASSGNGLFPGEPAGIWTGFDGKITKMNRKIA